MNKVALVTGATSGIGYANMMLLLEANINVIALGRDLNKINQIKEEVLNKKFSASLDFVIGDLSNNRFTNQVAIDIIDIINQKYYGKLDIMMNIAGRVTSGYHENEDQNELTFATNHLSIFLLTYHMVPFLRRSEDPRILVVSSLSHYRASINFNNIQNKKFYNILKSYKRSKLYNVFFVKEFTRRIQSINIYAIDPGLVNTNIGAKNTKCLARLVWNMRKNKGTDIYYPSRFMVDVALNKEYLDQNGQYIKEGKSIPSNPITYKEEPAKKLWDYSEELTNIKYKDLIK